MLIKFVYCVAVKFESLVQPSPDTDRKLTLLFQIPNRERACFSEIAPSETSYSAEHTPSMSSGMLISFL
jgi:hypothetical protein